MAFYFTRVEIYETRVQGLFLPGGDVWNFMNRLGRIHLALARVHAPKRSGVVAASHGYEIGPGNYRILGVRYTVYNTARHAIYPHEGTFSPIVAKGEKMRLRPGPGYPTPTYKKMVRGQTSQPWLWTSFYAARTAMGI